MSLNMLKNNTIIYTGPFDPLLRDGPSASFFDLMKFYSDKGYDTKIISFMHRESCISIDYIKDKLNGNIIVKKENGIVYSFKNVEININILPFSRNELLFEFKSEVLKSYKEVLQKFPDAIYFTVDYDFPCMMIHDIYRTNSYHIVRSPVAFVEHLKNNPVMLNVLKNKNLFAISQYAGNKIYKELGLKTEIWPPYIDFDRILANTKNNKLKNKTIGYYSAGPHKGDRIVEELIQLLPEYKFNIMGYNCSIPGSFDNVNMISKNIGPLTLYESISLLIVPSVIGEGYSRVIIEALANGIPVMANNTGGIPEALGREGLLIDITDKTEKATALEYARQIKQIFNNEKTYNLYSAAALKRAEQYKKELYRLNMKYLAFFQKNTDLRPVYAQGH